MKWSVWIVGMAALIGGLAAVVWFADLGGGSSAQAQNNSGPAKNMLVSNAPAGTLEGLISQKSGLSLDTINKIEAAGLAVAADKGTAKGLLTPSQAAALQPATVSPILNGLFDGAAQAAGVSDSDLFAAL